MVSGVSILGTFVVVKTRCFGVRPEASGFGFPKDWCASNNVPRAGTLLNGKPKTCGLPWLLHLSHGHCYDHLRGRGGGVSRVSGQVLVVQKPAGLPCHPQEMRQVACVLFLGNFLTRRCLLFVGGFSARGRGCATFWIYKVDLNRGLGTFPKGNQILGCSLPWSEKVEI